MNATKGLLWTGVLACFVGFESQGGSPLPAVAKLAVGQDFITKPGQKRKLLLSEDVTLLLNQATSGKHSAKGEIFLSAGEVYLDAKNFTIKTASRQVRLINGKVAVRVDKQGTSVIVIHGEAAVAGVRKAITAGYQLPAGAVEPSAVPRSSHALDWTKDLP